MMPHKGTKTVNPKLANSATEGDKDFYNDRKNKDIYNDCKDKDFYNDCKDRHLQ